MPPNLNPDDARAICEHMNDDHAEAVAVYARAYAGIADAQGAQLTSLDDQGMDLAVQTPRGPLTAHIAFDHALADRDDARLTLVAMLRDAPGSA